jgi:3-oxoacyl-[acyl-carrier-protein] synthase-3
VIDMRRTKRTYLKHNGIDAFAEANADAIRRVLNKALCDIGLTGDDNRIRYVVLPRFGARNLRESWIPVVSELLTAELLDWGPETGHLGAGDASAGIADLLKHELLRPGEIALVLSAGAGFTWSCLAVQAV